MFKKCVLNVQTSDSFVMGSGQLFRKTTKLTCRFWKMDLYHIIVAMAVVMATPSYANTECVWATGRLTCRRNQTLVLNSIVELFDLDGPSKVRFYIPENLYVHFCFAFHHICVGIWILRKLFSIILLKIAYQIFSVNS